MSISSYIFSSFTYTVNIYFFSIKKSVYVFECSASVYKNLMFFYLFFSHVFSGSSSSATFAVCEFVTNISHSHVNASHHTENTHHTDFQFRRVRGLYWHSKKSLLQRCCSYAYTHKKKCSNENTFFLNRRKNASISTKSNVRFHYALSDEKAPEKSEKQKIAEIHIHMHVSHIFFLFIFFFFTHRMHHSLQTTTILMDFKFDFKKDNFVYIDLIQLHVKLLHVPVYGLVDIGIILLKRGAVQLEK